MLAPIPVRDARCCEVARPSSQRLLWGRRDLVAYNATGIPRQSLGTGTRLLRPANQTGCPTCVAALGLTFFSQRFLRDRLLATEIGDQRLEFAILLAERHNTRTSSLPRSLNLFFY